MNKKTQTAIVLKEDKKGSCYTMMPGKGSKCYNVPFKKLVNKAVLANGQIVELSQDKEKVSVYSSKIETPAKRIDNLKTKALEIFSNEQIDAVTKNACLIKIASSMNDILNSLNAKKLEKINIENLTRILKNDCDNIARRSLESINARLLHSVGCAKAFVQSFGQKFNYSQSTM